MSEVVAVEIKHRIRLTDLAIHITGKLEDGRSYWTDYVKCSLNIWSQTSGVPGAELLLNHQDRDSENNHPRLQELNDEAREILFDIDRTLPGLLIESGIPVDDKQGLINPGPVGRCDHYEQKDIVRVRGDFAARYVYVRFRGRDDRMVPVLLPTFDYISSRMREIYPRGRMDF